MEHLLVRCKDNFFTGTQQATLHVDDMAVDPPEFLFLCPVYTVILVNLHLLLVLPGRRWLPRPPGEQDEIELEANRVFKKRRTSSKSPED